MDEVYRHWTRRMVYTLGVQILAEQHGAFWWIDLIASHQTNPKARAEAFQVWTLRVNPDKSAVATMTDGNSSTPIITQRIEFTDFAGDECELFLILGGPGEPATLMLPGEY